MFDPAKKQVGVWRIPRLPHQVTKRPAEKGRRENAVKVKKSERREKRLSPFLLLSSPLCLAMCAIYRPAEPVRACDKAKEGPEEEEFLTSFVFKFSLFFYLPCPDSSHTLGKKRELG